MNSSPSATQDTTSTSDPTANGSRIQVREARAGDLEAILALYAELSGEPRTRRGQSATPTEAASFRKILAAPSRHLVVAELEDTEGRFEVAGTCDVTVITNLSRGGRPYAVCENIVVTAGHRRQGVGAALMEHAVAYAQGRRCYKIQVVAAGRRSEAHQMYEKAGFGEDVRGFRRYLD